MFRRRARQDQRNQLTRKTVHRLPVPPARSYAKLHFRRPHSLNEFYAIGGALAANVTIADATIDSRTEAFTGSQAGVAPTAPRFSRRRHGIEQRD